MNYRKLSNALKIASVAHKEQVEKGPGFPPSPYIYHPVFVGMKLIELRCPDDVVIAGILHDTIEDTKLPREIIKKNFGEKVLEYINSVTEPKDLEMTREEKKKTWTERKEKYLENLKKSSIEAKLIAAVDLLHNLFRLNSSIKNHGKEESFKSFNASIEKKFWLFEEELKIFKNTLQDYNESLIKPIKAELKELKKLLR